MSIAFTSTYTGISNRLINEVAILSEQARICNVVAQWDTGAMGTCISKTVVERLSLAPISRVNVYTPSGERTLDAYVIDVRLPNNLLIKNVRAVGGEIAGQGIDILIGMDIIGLGDFAVTNYNRQTVFSFRFPSSGCIDFVKDEYGRI